MTETASKAQSKLILWVWDGHQRLPGCFCSLAVACGWGGHCSLSCRACSCSFAGKSVWWARLHFRGRGQQELTQSVLASLLTSCRKAILAVLFSDRNHYLPVSFSVSVAARVLPATSFSEVSWRRCKIRTKQNSTKKAWLLRAEWFRDGLPPNLFPCVWLPEILPNPWVPIFSSLFSVRSHGVPCILRKLLIPFRILSEWKGTVILKVIWNVQCSKFT